MAKQFKQIVKFSNVYFDLSAGENSLLNLCSQLEHSMINRSLAIDSSRRIFDENEVSLRNFKGKLDNLDGQKMIEKMCKDFYDANIRGRYDEYIESHTLFDSAFPYILNIIKNGKEIHNNQYANILLLLDEVESSFHPKWQQKILELLTDFLSSKYIKYDFHIILTSHSPVILSDIPRKNVVFLSSDNLEHKETFAANIASLYYDSFFMDEGSIGKIAQRTIIRLLQSINIVEQAKNTSNDKKDIAKLKKIFVNSFFKLDNINNSAEEINEQLFEEKFIEIIEIIEMIAEPLWRNKIKSQIINLFTEDENNNYLDIYGDIEKILKDGKENELREVIKKLVK